jgi:hypothetical protein
MNPVCPPVRDRINKIRILDHVINRHLPQFPFDRLPGCSRGIPAAQPPGSGEVKMPFILDDRKTSPGLRIRFIINPLPIFSLIKAFIQSRIGDGVDGLWLILRHINKVNSLKLTGRLQDASVIFTSIIGFIESLRCPRINYRIIQRMNGQGADIGLINPVRCLLPNQ